MKKVSSLVTVLVVTLLFAVSANAGGWDWGRADSNANGKYVTIPGTAGLEVAAKECAHLLGEHEWQQCVADHDGLYTLNPDGTIKRNFVRTADATFPNPSGPVECRAQFKVRRDGLVTWEIPQGADCRVRDLK